MAFTMGTRVDYTTDTFTRRGSVARHQVDDGLVEVAFDYGVEAVDAALLTEVLPPPPPPPNKPAKPVVAPVTDSSSST